MTSREIHDRVQAILEARGDDETAHAMEDQLRSDFIHYIAATDTKLGGLAEAVLGTEAISFNRWCA